MKVDTTVHKIQRNKFLAPLEAIALLAAVAQAHVRMGKTAHSSQPLLQIVVQETIASNTLNKLALLEATAPKTLNNQSLAQLGATAPENNKQDQLTALLETIAPKML